MADTKRQERARPNCRTLIQFGYIRKLVMISYFCIFQRKPAIVRLLCHGAAPTKLCLHARSFCSKMCDQYAIPFLSPISAQYTSIRLLPSSRRAKNWSSKITDDDRYPQSTGTGQTMIIHKNSTLPFPSFHQHTHIYTSYTRVHLRPQSKLSVYLVFG